MSKNILNYNLVKIYTANILFTSSLLATIMRVFMYLPEGNTYYGIPVERTFEIYGFFILTFALGIVLFGMFNSYILEIFNRKKVFAVSVVALSVFLFVDIIHAYNFITRLVSMFLMGGFSLLAYSAITTMSIDVTASDCRTKGNLLLHITSCVGMVLSVFVFTVHRYLPFEEAKFLSLIPYALSVFEVVRMRMIFRAPIKTNLISLDKFLLPKSWLLSINLYVTFFFAILLFAFSFNIYLCQQIGSEEEIISPIRIIIPLVSVVVSSLYAYKYILGKQLLYISLAGFALLSVCFFSIKFSPLLYLALSSLALPLIISSFLVMSLRLTSHCQRATANINQTVVCLLSFVSVVPFVFPLSYYTELYKTFFIIMFLANVIVFLVATYPYYLKKKLR